jgi:hypothetical protein
MQTELLDQPQINTEAIHIDEVNLLRRKVEAKRRMVAAAKEFGLPFYKPHPKQLSFHLAQAKFRAVFAGNRFGKSQCGVAEDCSWIVGERMFLPPDDPGRKAGIPQRPVKGLILCADWDKCEEIFTCESDDPHLKGKIWKNIPRSFVKKLGHNSSGKVDRIEFHNGALLCFDTVKSFMNNPMGSESSDWDFIHVDEPIPQAMWKAVSRGLIDRNGWAWFTLTNLSEPWIFEMFFPSAKSKNAKREVLHYDASGKLAKWALVGSIYDNPYLSPDAIAAFEAELTEDEKQCRLYGLAIHLSGLVYKEFQYERHVLASVPENWIDFHRPPANYTLHYAIDTHPRKPHDVLFCAVSPAGRMFFFYEIFKPCLIPELCDEILAIRNLYKNVGLELCELGAWEANPVDGMTMGDMMINYGLNVQPAPKSLKAGILSVKKALAHPDLVYFSPNLPNFFGEIMKYGWDTKSDKLDKPVDRNDHAMENLYRLILSEPYYIKPEDTNFEVNDDTIETADLGAL